MTLSMQFLHEWMCAKGYEGILEKKKKRKDKEKRSPGSDFRRTGWGGRLHQRSGALFGLSQPLNLSPAWGSLCQDPVPYLSDPITDSNRRLSPSVCSSSGGVLANWKQISAYKRAGILLGFHPMT